VSTASLNFDVNMQVRVFHLIVRFAIDRMSTAQLHNLSDLLHRLNKDFDRICKDCEKFDGKWQLWLAYVYIYFLAKC